MIGNPYSKRFQWSETFLVLDVDILYIGDAVNTTGSLTVGAGQSYTVTNAEQIGNEGTGTVTQSGGTHTVKNLFLGAGYPIGWPLSLNMAICWQDL